MNVFSAAVVQSVCGHMNANHHSPDNVLIVRAFAEVEPENAEMTGLDQHAGFWRYHLAGENHELRVPWSKQIAERTEIRREIVKLYDAACQKLGITPRPHN